MISDAATINGIDEKGQHVTGQRKIRTLIVDDSSAMRQLIRHYLSRHGDIEVVAEADSARAARDAVNMFKPDVMTLDVEMPEMDGLEFLRRLMKARPMPVVMVSSLTERGSEAAIRALSLGALECIAKPGSGKAGQDAFKGLATVLRMAATAQVKNRIEPREAAQKTRPTFSWNGKLVLVGASTGGVEALETVLAGFPENCPPTLITQHMPEQFLISFAARLNRNFAPHILLAEDGQVPEQGCVYIAPGGERHLTLKGTPRPKMMLQPGPKQTGHRPSVDVMFSSAVSQASNVVAVLLTGMGADGAQGMRMLRDNGAFCIAQDQQSSVVYGMPRVACEKGGVDISLDLSRISGKILALASVGAVANIALRKVVP